MELCQPNNRLLCATCKGIMRGPVQAACGHRFCEGCLTESVCRHCLCTTAPVFRDNAVAQELVVAAVRCVMCPWVGTVAEYRQGHVMEHEGMQPCPFAVLGCATDDCDDTVEDHQQLLVKCLKSATDRIKALEANVNNINMERQAIAARFAHLEMATQNGTLVWLVPVASDCPLPMILSPVFYTHRNGYAMCVRMYPKGDGSGAGTHMSMYFNVLKGPADDKLEWPFSKHVTVSLVGQEPGVPDIVHSLRSNFDSVSFKKPVGVVANIPIGWPTFCPLTCVPMYTKNGQLCVTVHVCDL
nr:tumor necrosis factor receptor-associated factor [Megalocytivirus FD201807]